jgi:DNA-binding CsgD family transcriptional regulator
MSLLAIERDRRPASPSFGRRVVATSSRLPASDPARDLPAAQRRLQRAESVPELFGCACETAPEWCGFERALMVSVADGRLDVSDIGSVLDPKSELLRQRLSAAAPVAVRPGIEEAEIIGLAEGARRHGARLPSVLAGVLGLEHFAIGAVMPEDRVLALLVLDRSSDPPTAGDRYTVQVFAQLLAAAVERLILRQRMAEFATELRYLTASAQALCKEGLDSPVALPIDYGSGSVFASASPVGRVESGATDQPREPFTRRELTIVQEMVAGRSNREIAEELQLSPETVKKYVARVIHKMGAANRGDAAVRYLRLTSTAN